MGEDQISADEARQVPWLKRTKAQRKALQAEANAKINAKQKERLDRIDQWHGKRMASIEEKGQQAAAQRAARSAPGPQAQLDRRLHRTARLLEISAWLELLPYIFGAVIVLVVLVAIVVIAL